MNPRDHIFAKEKVPKAVLTLALPTIFTQLVTVIYNLADTYFVGRANDPNMVAAVSLCLPLFYFFLSCGGIYGVGGGTYISRLLGQQRQPEAKHVSAYAFYSGIALSILSAALFLIFRNPLLRLLGTSANTYDFTSSYFTIMSLGAPFMIMQNVLAQMMRAEGASKNAMYGLILGSVVNIILDPLMITTWGFGVAGAATATVIGNICAVSYFLWYILRKKDTCLSLRLRDFKFSRQITSNVYKIGIPTALNTFLICVANLILNNFAASYGDITVAAVGVAYRIAQFFRLLIIGLAQGTQPLIAYNYAAKNYRRMFDATKFAATIGILFGIFAFTLVQFTAPQLISIFLDNPEVIELGAVYVRLYVAALPVLVLLFLFMSSFQAFGKAVQATIISIGRDGVLFVPLILICRHFFGRIGIMCAQPLTDILTVLFSGIMYYHIYKKLKAEMLATQSSPVLPLDPK